MPAIYLVAAWPPGAQGQIVDADVNVAQNESIKSVVVCTEKKQKILQEDAGSNL